jgi:hypothetical protein
MSLGHQHIIKEKNMAGFLGGLLGGNDKAKQEEIGKAMQSLSDQIGALQQQGKGKDGEIEQLQAQLAQAQALQGSGDQAKKQLQDAQAALAVAQADKQASDLILQNAQKQISELQAQLHQLEDAAKAAPTVASHASAAAAAVSAAAGGLAVGAAAWVRQEGGKGLRRHTGPGLSSHVVDALAPGTQLALLEGPSDADGHHWWKVRAADGREGWVAGEELVSSPE